jgi:hypothetical protein
MQEIEVQGEQGVQQWRRGPKEEYACASMTRSKGREEDCKCARSTRKSKKAKGSGNE